MVKKYIKTKLYNLVLAERSPSKLAISFCWGMFIGCTPTIPFQTPILVFLSWLLRLNPTVAISAAWIINNPVTIVPIYTANYLFGSWLFQSIFNINLVEYNPWFVDNFNAFLSKYIDLSKYFIEEGFCFWCFILGSFILPLIVSLLAYWPLNFLFQKLTKFLHLEEKIK